MEVLKETIIHKNLNVYQNLNIADTITSNTNIVKHNLIIPTHDNNSNLLNPINGSIYYNTTNKKTFEVIFCTRDLCSFSKKL